jgi:hypothetical protein
LILGHAPEVEWISGAVDLSINPVWIAARLQAATCNAPPGWPFMI